MNDISGSMQILTVLWLATVIYAARLCQRAPYGSVGLPAAFLFAMTFLYCNGFLYSVPGYTHLRLEAPLGLRAYKFTDETVSTGAWTTLIAIVGFTLGIRLHATPTMSYPVIAKSRQTADYDAEYKKIYTVLVGVSVAGFLIPYLQIQLPMIQAFQQVGQNLGITTVCLGFLTAWKHNNRTAQAWWLAAAAFIPVWYLVVFGFMSYGFVAVTLFAAFILCQTGARAWGKPKLAIVILGVGYGCLTLFTLYMSSRDQLRAVLWSTSSLSDRLSVIGATLGDLKLLSPFDFGSFDFISMRLNQGSFVGKVVEWHDVNPDLRTYGESLFLSLLAWVPRALWPGKPEMGKSTMLEVNSGLRFSEGSTFGAGQVIEFYANFGYVGVFLGFVALGILMARLDLKAAIALRTGRLMDFVRNFTIGIALVAPLTDLFFVVSNCIATWLALKGLDLALQMTGARNSRRILATAGPRHRIPVARDEPGR